MLDVVVEADLRGVGAPECEPFLECLVFTFGKSEIRLPDADGGSLARGGDESRDDGAEGEWSFCDMLRRRIVSSGSCKILGELDSDVEACPVFELPGT